MDSFIFCSDWVTLSRVGDGAVSGRHHVNSRVVVHPLTCKNMKLEQTCKRCLSKFGDVWKENIWGWAENICTEVAAHEGAVAGLHLDPVQLAAVRALVVHHQPQLVQGVHLHRGTCREAIKEALCDFQYCSDETRFFANFDILIGENV